MDNKDKKLELKTFKFEDFKNKIDEGAERVGFNTYKRHSFEEEEDNVDDLGAGEEIDTDVIEDTPIVDEVEVEDTPDTVEGNNDAIDTGDSDITGKQLIEKINDLGKLAKSQEITTTDMKNIYNDIDTILKKYDIDL